MEVLLAHPSKTKAQNLHKYSSYSEESVLPLGPCEQDEKKTLMCFIGVWQSAMKVYLVFMRGRV